jgi:hypothetical protein
MFNFFFHKLKVFVIKLHFLHIIEERDVEFCNITSNLQPN